MKLKVLSTQHSGGQLYTAGMTRDVNDDIGKQLIASGLAEAIDEDAELADDEQEEEVKKEKNIIQVGKIGDKDGKDKNQ